MILNLKDYTVPIFSGAREGKNLKKTEADSYQYGMPPKP